MTFYKFELVIKTRALLLCTCLICISFFGCKEKTKTYESITPNVALKTHFKENIAETILFLDSLEKTTSNKRVYFYKQARARFKTLEPLLAFIDSENYKFLNQPNILKVEEEDATDIKIKSPKGFQVLEEQLFGDTSKNELLKNTKVIKDRLQLIATNTHLNIKKHHVIWLLRDAIARVALTGVTGFDSPVLEESLSESKIVYKEIEYLLNIYKSNFKDQSILKQWTEEFVLTQEKLTSKFEAFNRYYFIKNHTHKQLELLVKTQNDWQVEFPFELALKNDITSLFSAKTFNLNYFSDINKATKNAVEKSNLGKRLFNDVNLSKSKAISCASCHQKEKAFTDGLKQFKGQTRNTPTLHYAALQKSFFHDGRAGSLEGQIINVINNENEFHSDLKTITKAVSSNSDYVNDFNTLYGKITDRTIRQAMANYIRSLTTFNSKFDRNINGLENTLTAQEINGFNLFNGKAKCATCHFAPVFNGTVPPNFKESELEAIGVPNDTLTTSKISNDFGRYNLFKTEERKHFFKTPTVRNISKTAPYMHNGVYITLEQVMTFYNNGGGSGVGINLEYQTLPTDSLKLKTTEIQDIIAFMKALEDK